MVDRSAQGFFQAMNEFRGQAQELRQIAQALKDGDGSGTSGGMDSRVTKLETHMEYVRHDLAEIKSDLKSVTATLATLPTKRDLTANIYAGIAIGLAVMAIVVGGIVGGLGWLQTHAPAPPPAASSAK